MTATSGLDRCYEIIGACSKRHRSFTQKDIAAEVGIEVTNISKHFQSMIRKGILKQLSEYDHSKRKAGRYLFHRRKDDFNGDS